MSIKRFYRFSYYGRRQRGKNLLIHQLRDADAAMEVSSVLHALGYRYGGLLLNYPGMGPEGRREINESFLKSEDLILMTTRPPLDEFEAPRSPILRSYTTLEQKIFECLQAKYFHHCSRTEIDLVNSLAVRLPQHVADRADASFRQYKGAFSERYSGRKRDGHPLTTMLYMTFTPHIWIKGPALLTAFGMGGPETLIWAHLLRCRYSDLVCTRSFVMAEMTEQEIAPEVNDLSFADHWHVNIIAEIAVDTGEKPKRKHATGK